MAGRIIGLVGPIASGKSAAADALIHDRGFAFFSLSNLVREVSGRRQGMTYADILPERLREEEARRRQEQVSTLLTGIPRTDLQSVSSGLRTQHGQAILAETMVKIIQQKWENGTLDRNADIVIEGIRGDRELEYLMEHLHVQPIGVTASQEERWIRVSKKRKREGDPHARREFVRQDNFELGPDGNNITRALEICAREGIVIDNTGKGEEYTKDAVLRIVDGLTTAEGQVHAKERAY